MPLCSSTSEMGDPAPPPPSRAKKPTNDSKQWFRPSQSRAATLAEIRRGKVSPPRRGSGRHTAPPGGGASLESAMNQLLKGGDEAPLTPEQQAEVRKQELVGKIGTFIKSSSIPR